MKILYWEADYPKLLQVFFLLQILAAVSDRIEDVSITSQFIYLSDPILNPAWLVSLVLPGGGKSHELMWLHTLNEDLLLLSLNTVPCSCCKEAFRGSFFRHFLLPALHSPFYCHLPQVIIRCWLCALWGRGSSVLFIDSIWGRKKYFFLPLKDCFNIWR